MSDSKTETTRRRLMATVATCLVLTNCAEISNSFHGKTMSMSGAGVVLDQPFEPYNETMLTRLIVAAAPNDSLGDTSSLDGAIGSFSKALYAKGATTSSVQNQMRDARNQVQGMLLTDSANRCDAFKLLLRERSTNTTFWLGSLATVLGAAGAIVSGGASQALAGAAGAASGVGAEYNKDIMANVTSSVIIPGIDKQRSGILQEILNRRCLGVSSYDLGQAMTDAVRYHASCSTDVGVAAASAALSKTSKVNSPSLTEAADTVNAVLALRDKLNGKGGGAAGGGRAGAGASGLASGSGGGTGAGAADSASGGATGAAIKLDATASTSKTNALVGDQIDYLQCPSLDANGMLPPDGIPKASTAGASGNQVQYGTR